MCGIVGMCSNIRTKLSQDMFDKLISIQHRGSDFSGMISEGQNLKNTGSVQSVFEPHLLQIFNGNYLLGHVTSYNPPFNKYQLFSTFSPCDIVLCHNGVLTNRDKILRLLETKYRIVFEVKSDAHLIIQFISCKIQKYFRKYNKTKIDDYCVNRLVSSIYNCLEGSFSMLIIFRKYGMIALRDSMGLFPLFYGEINPENNIPTVIEHLVGSETVIFNNENYEEIKPGQCVVFSINYKAVRKIDKHICEPLHCLIEYFYMSGQSSILNDLSIYQVRFELGKLLGEKIASTYGCYNIYPKFDLIVPSSDNARIFASGVQEILQVPLRDGVSVDAQGRTTFIEGVFKNKTILLIDDNIIQGKAPIKMIKSIQKFSIKHMYIGSICPKIFRECFYGKSVCTLEKINILREQIKDLHELHVPIIYNSLSQIKSFFRKRNMKNIEISMFTKSWCFM